MAIALREPDMELESPDWKYTSEFGDKGALNALQDAIRKGADRQKELYEVVSHGSGATATC
jgi:hypothetical protein